MSLIKEQKIATKQELADNLTLTGLTTSEVAAELNTSEAKIERILNLKQNSLNDGWIFRNYLLKKVAEKGLTPVPFTAIGGDYHDYWFLDSRIIETGVMSKGNR
ncbi:DUF2316 family protein [Listeria ivanovii]|uniref:DUF2316 family protein n=1 Tax=Listeria ivanovii (strain ATCC BAA-678 / PAM 55) TaxID=881621 RepID=G2ZDM5_LISIP|nr:DUF2316 family protein [Listeria ivanovii]AHI55369.1 hypothetical protein AX25_04420 [Listeria ivanovii WSLC3009]AIS64827.1 hypothetical protein JL52_04345 [Listeria ivanovii subsp. ivanovii]MBC1758461.1 DUF2316 family protein [Listeria ivanovii]MBK3913336.1 DUF2316 family protein [Listeria ivanovii subsp. ivanovii]MBK3920547.1 DUF2316 family protein [Listeria ivanovii subsp. ivanovii]